MTASTVWRRYPGAPVHRVPTRDARRRLAQASRTEQDPDRAKLLWRGLNSTRCGIHIGTTGAVLSSDRAYGARCPICWPVTR